jgi:hypothetical protein
VQFEDLRQVLFHSLWYLEADFVEKKAWPAKIGHFTRSIQGKSRFREGGGSDDMGRSWFSKGALMRGIAFMFAAAMVVAGGAAATADESVAPRRIKLALFPFELEDFSAAAAYHRLTISIASNCGSRRKRRAV